jgi:tetratricopeptide (TPR) repeat protein
LATAFGQYGMVLQAAEFFDVAEPCYLNAQRLAPDEVRWPYYLAGLYKSRGETDKAEASFKRALTLQPDDLILWNQMAYAQVYAGDLDGALQSLKRYAALRPAEANPLDSMGDVYYAFGRFAEAEKSYKDAQAKDPNFAANGSLLKAAHARDRRRRCAMRCSTNMQVGSGQDPAIEYRRAEWEYLRMQKAARSSLENFAATC